jgi:capsular polysaccharide biosynthesis protein
VNIVQQASFVAKASSPKPLLVLLAGFVFAAAGAVLLAFAAEHLDQSLKTSDQIEQELGIPVLFAVPRGVRHELLHN